MSLPLIFHPDVDEDVREARDFYESKQPGLGDDFVEAVEIVQARIAANPLLHQIIWQTVRRGLVRRFPYGVFYRVLTGRVEVIAVYHLHRDPSGWQARA
jgi:plasmid stabilization system protein ParE